MTRHHDAAIHVITAPYALRQFPNSLWDLVGHQVRWLSEKELTTRVLSDRFKMNCGHLIAAARKCDYGPVVVDISKTRNLDLAPELPYDQIGNILGGEVILTIHRNAHLGHSQAIEITAERLLREVENDFASLLHAASSLEDLICNSALALSSGQHAWIGCGNDRNGTLPRRIQSQRINCRTFLRASYSATNHDCAPLEWVTRKRNVFTHEKYAYATIIKNAGEIVFTSESPEYRCTDIANQLTLTANRALPYANVLRTKYLDWFIGESERQLAA